VSERTFGSGGGGGGRNYEAPDMERGGSRRGAPPPEGDGKSRDFSNWERRGPLSPIPGAEPVRGPGRVRNLEGEERRNSPSWGEGRSQDGSRTRPGPGAEVRDRPPPPERKPTAAEQDNEWRARMRPDPPIKSKTPTPDPSTPSSPSHAPAPAGRPKLNLAKRTVSEAQPASTHESASGDAKASPFGAARPIDTAAREREVEEKRQAALKEKKEEAEEKALEEKKTREVAPKSAVPKEAEEGSVSADGKTNGSEEPEASNITVLSRPKDGDNIEKEKANGSERPIPTHPRNRGPPREPREPREPRGPREPRESRDPNDPPRGPRNNAGPRDWRRKTSGGPGQSNPASPVTPAAGPDDDGWSTVAPKQKGGPKGRGSNAPRTTAA
jgi:translation initiation factor 4B